jgi:hypothetical protein
MTVAGSHRSTAGAPSSANDAVAGSNDRVANNADREMFMHEMITHGYGFAINAQEAKHARFLRVITVCHGLHDRSQKRKTPGSFPPGVFIFSS